jgi:hypothetical protein
MDEPDANWLSSRETLAMASSPGTVSRILWHFTGGPVWDEAAQRQKKELKSIEKAYMSLCKIIESKNLRIGSYKEVVRVSLEVDEPTASGIVKPTKITRELLSAPVVCLADIPIMHLSYHAERYGKIALGFHRQSVISHGFSPVFYQLCESNVLSSIFNAFGAVSMLAEKRIIEIDPSIEISPESMPTFLELLGTPMQVEAEFANDLVSWAQISFEEFIAFVKTFNHDEIDTIYCEREWRSTKPFDFAFDAVAMIVVPRNNGQGNHYEKFVAEAEALGVPRTVPVVAWEDLVEH